MLANKCKCSVYINFNIPMHFTTITTKSPIHVEPGFPCIHLNTRNFLHINFIYDNDINVKYI